MAPIFNLHSEDFFWGINILLGVIFWLMIGYYYAKKTYERYFELDYEGFDDFRYRDALLFPMMIMNYLPQKEEIPIFISSKKEHVYIPIVMIIWPLKILSLFIWLFLLAGAHSYMTQPYTDETNPQFPID